MKRIVFYTVFPKFATPNFIFPFFILTLSIRAVKSPPIGGLFTKLEGCFEEGRMCSFGGESGAAPFSPEHDFIIEGIL